METFVPYHHLFSNTCRTLYMEINNLKIVLVPPTLQAEPRRVLSRVIFTNYILHCVWVCIVCMHRVRLYVFNVWHLLFLLPAISSLKYEERGSWSEWSSLSSWLARRCCHAVRSPRGPRLMTAPGFRVRYSEIGTVRCCNWISYLLRLVCGSERGWIVFVTNWFDW